MHLRIRPPIFSGSEDAIAFDAICRTNNVNRVLWLLSDYHQSLGDKRITVVHWSPKLVGSQDEGVEKGDILIEIAQAAQGDIQENVENRTRYVESGD